MGRVSFSSLPTLSLTLLACVFFDWIARYPVDFFNTDIMSKADDLLLACKKNVGKWTCGYCGSNSNQPAATFRELKKRGYKFEEPTPGRWGKEMWCPECSAYRTHYKLLALEPVLPEHERCPIDKRSRERVLTLLGGRDAFTGGSISSVAEIDHKTPWTRMEGDLDIRSLSDEQIRQHFQLLTREHNLLKDRMCGRCKAENIRPPFLGIKFWYSGTENYCGSCYGCGWYDGVRWREELNKKLGK